MMASADIDHGENSDLIAADEDEDEQEEEIPYDYVVDV